MSFLRYIYLLLFIVVSACSQQEPESSDSNVIRVGVLPDQDTAVLQKRYLPLLSYLEKKTGLKYELVIPESYPVLLEKFNGGKLGMAYFGAVTFLKASKAEALVTRDVDNRFTSVIVVPANSKAQTLQDLKGKSFSFGSKLSTSGHYMPRYFMQESGINPEKFFQDVKFSKGHDKTAYLVRDGKTDAGAMNAVVYEVMQADGRLSNNSVKVIWESPPYQDYVWAVRADMSDIKKAAIRDVFLGLSKEDPAQKIILAEIGANYFLPASIEDFEKLQSVIKKVNYR